MSLPQAAGLVTGGSGGAARGVDNQVLFPGCCPSHLSQDMLAEGMSALKPLAWRTTATVTVLIRAGSTLLRHAWAQALTEHSIVCETVQATAALTGYVRDLTQLIIDEKVTAASERRLAEVALNAVRPLA